MEAIFDSKGLRVLAGIVLGMLALFLLGQTIQSFKGVQYVGTAPVSNTITVSGHGEVFVAPDIATVSFSVEKTAPTVADANTQTTAAINAIVAGLKSLDIADKDIQTSSYSVYPKYEYPQIVCVRAPCVSNEKLVGYTVSNSVTIKIRNLDNAGKVISALADNGATNVSGLDFTNENPEAGKNDARGMAIAKARAQAEIQAKQLGVSLIGITSFSEGYSGGYASYNKVSMAMDSAMAPQSAPTPLSPGQNKISSDVSITYQIR